MRILADPYFKGVPSLQPEQKKTALGFHAKDDLPEVRREVFSWLVGQPFRFLACRDKRVILEKVLRAEQVEALVPIPSQSTLRPLRQSSSSRNGCTKGDGFKIYFARRGTKDRSEALRKALEAARTDFRRSGDIEGDAPIEIVRGQL